MMREIEPVIVIIFVSYGIKNVSKSKNAVDSICKALTASTIKIWVNNSTDIVKIRDLDFDDWHIVKGSNKVNEFSGYQEGLSYFLNFERLETYKNVTFLIINDTLAVHHRFDFIKRQLIVSAIHDVISDRYDCAGWSNKNNAGFLFLGKSTHTWLSSYLLIIKGPCLERMQFKIYDPLVEKCLSGKALESEFFSHCVSHKTASWLKCWLFGTGDGPKWRSHAAINDKNFKNLQKKALCIFSELLFSNKLFSQDLKICQIQKSSILGIIDLIIDRVRVKIVK